MLSRSGGDAVRDGTSAVLVLSLLLSPHPTPRCVCSITASAPVRLALARLQAVQAWRAFRDDTLVPLLKQQ